MSISSSSPYTWPQSFQWQFHVGAPGDNRGTPATDIETAAQNNSVTPSPGPAAPGTGASTLYHQLAADIQAVLIEGQATSSTPNGSTTWTSSGDSTVPASLGGETTATDPTDQLATNIQSIHFLVQANQADTETTTRTTTTGQLDPSSKGQPPHQHHHHGGGARVTETSAVGTSATTGTSPAVASRSTAASDNSALTGVQTTPQALSADIQQAWQSYGSLTSTKETPGVTA
jgi:hypothetical protein